MKKALVILTILVTASWAGAETLWGVFDDYAGAPSSTLFSFESSTGAIGTTIDLSAVGIHFASGLVVDGSTAIISNGYDLHQVSLSTGSLLASVTMTDYMNGLAWDGTNLYGADYTTGNLAVISATGALTQGAAYFDPNSSSFWGWLACRPSDGAVIGWGSQQYFQTFTDPSNPAATAVRTGRNSSMDYYQGGAFLSNDQFVATHGTNLGFYYDDENNLFNGGAVQQWSFAPQIGVNGVYALSQVYGTTLPTIGVPEPATMGLLGIGAMGLLRRRR